METLEKIKKTINKIIFDLVMCGLVALLCLWPVIFIENEGYVGFEFIFLTIMVITIWLIILTFIICVIRHYSNYYERLD